MSALQRVARDGVKGERGQRGVGSRCYAQVLCTCTRGGQNKMFDSIDRQVVDDAIPRKARVLWAERGGT